jgi:hypothetical protein
MRKTWLSFPILVTMFLTTFDVASLLSSVASLRGKKVNLTLHDSWNDAFLGQIK